MADDLDSWSLEQLISGALQLTYSGEDNECWLGLMVLRELGEQSEDGRRPFSELVVPRLLELLAAGPEPAFEQLLIQALAFNGAREALVEFTSRIDHPDVDIRRSMAFQLPSVIDAENVDQSAALALEALCHDPDADTRYYALHALTVEGLTLDKTWLEEIAARMVHDPDLKIRQLALNALPGSPELYASWSSSELVAAFTHGDTDDDWLAWKYVSELQLRGDEESAEQGLAALADDSPQLRRFGAWVLGQFESGPMAERRWRGRFIAVLMAAAAVETDEAVMEGIATALCWLQAEEGVPWMLGLCRTGGSELRTGLAMMLTHFGSGRRDVMEALTTLVTDPEESVRDWASFAFTNHQSDYDSPRLRDNLLQISRDPNRVTAAQAIHALSSRGDRRVLPALAEALLHEPDDETYLLVEAAQALPDPILLPGITFLLGMPAYAGDDDLTALVVRIEVARLEKPDEP